MSTTATVRHLYGTFRVLIHEAAKFSVVGLATFGLDLAVFNVLSVNGVGPLTSKAFSTLLAAVASYFANRHWTFSHRGRRGVMRELWLFIVLCAVGFAIVEACLAISYYGMGLHSLLAKNLSANGVGLVLGTLFRFWSFKRWVFIDVPEPEPLAEVAAAIQ